MRFSFAGAPLWAPRNLKSNPFFFQRIERPSFTERLAYLDEVCADQPELRDRVELLLRAEQELGGFLESEPAGSSHAVDQSVTTSLCGTEIGPFTLLQLIGEGGMGTVYRARKGTGDRDVALKIIKPGMNKTEVISRFEAERRALAIMDHPNIAKVLDAGTTPSGRPYFVMESVDGVPHHNTRMRTS